MWWHLAEPWTARKRLWFPAELSTCLSHPRGHLVFFREMKLMSSKKPAHGCSRRLRPDGWTIKQQMAEHSGEEPQADRSAARAGGTGPGCALLPRDSVGVDKELPAARVGVHMAEALKCWCFCGDMQSWVLGPVVVTPRGTREITQSCQHTCVRKDGDVG